MWQTESPDVLCLDTINVVSKKKKKKLEQSEKKFEFDLHFCTVYFFTKCFSTFTLKTVKKKILCVILMYSSDTDSHHPSMSNF